MRRARRKEVALLLMVRIRPQTQQLSVQGELPALLRPKKVSPHAGSIDITGEEAKKDEKA